MAGCPQVRTRCFRISLRQSHSGNPRSATNSTSRCTPLMSQMVLAPDMRLQSAAVKTPQSEHFETPFESGQQGVPFDLIGR